MSAIIRAIPKILILIVKVSFLVLEVTGITPFETAATAEFRTAFTAFEIIAVAESALPSERALAVLKVALEFTTRTGSTLVATVFITISR